MSYSTQRDMQFESAQRRRSRRQQDVVETALHSIDRATISSTGTSLFHILTVASIGASIALFASGRRLEGIFIGLWPPTFEALKAAADKQER